MKFGESLQESNRYTVKTIVKDPATMAGGEKNEPKERSRVVLAKTPDEARKKVADDLKERGYSIVSQTIIKTEKLSESEALTETLQEKSKGLWANIHARRKKGLRPKRPGEKGYPKTLDIESVEVEESDEIKETAEAGLKAKAEKSGVSLSILRKVYDRGFAAWKTGHRPGTTPQQWAMARVNSYITKGKTYHTTDKDLREDTTPKDKETGIPKKYVSGLSASTAKERAAHFKKNSEKDDSDPTAYKPAPGDANAKTKESKYTKKYRELYGEDMNEELYEASCDGNKQTGIKKRTESNNLESVLGLIRRIKEQKQKKTMLVARPNNLRKPGQERVVRIPVEKWNDYRKKGFIQAEEKENENS
jgi:hypothetical protein